jgi:predicted transcriptional regulator
VEPDVRLPLTDRELDLMDVLWRRGPSTAAEVREQLQARGLDLAYNTVQTILRILEDKAYVGHTAEGRAHRFHPLVERQAVGASALARTLDRLFGGSAEALVSHLVRQRGLSRDELASLRRLLDEELGPAPAPRRGGRAP